MSPFFQKQNLRNKMDNEVETNIYFQDILENYTFESIIQIYGINSTEYKLSKTIAYRDLMNEIFFKNTHEYKTTYTDPETNYFYDLAIINRSDFYFKYNAFSEFIMTRDEENALIFIKRKIQENNLVTSIQELKIGNIIKREINHLLYTFYDDDNAEKLTYLSKLFQLNYTKYNTIKNELLSFRRMRNHVLLYKLYTSNSEWYANLTRNKSKLESITTDIENTAKESLNIYIEMKLMMLL